MNVLLKNAAFLYQETVCAINFLYDCVDNAQWNKEVLRKKDCLAGDRGESQSSLSKSATFTSLLTGLVALQHHAIERGQSLL